MAQPVGLTPRSLLEAREVRLVGARADGGQRWWGGQHLDVAG
jgi:hypothetical protein